MGRTRYSARSPVWTPLTSYVIFGDVTPFRNDRISPTSRKIIVNEMTFSCWASLWILTPVGNIGDSSDLHPIWNISTHVNRLCTRLLESQLRALSRWRVDVQWENCSFIGRSGVSIRYMFYSGQSVDEYLGQREEKIQDWKS